MDIIKRTGSIEVFDRNKIRKAILKANASVNQNLKISDVEADDIAKSVEQECLDFKHVPTVEEVQDLVEDALIETGHTQLGKSYIKYRTIQTIKRVTRQQQKHYENVKEKLMAENVQNQNANVDEHSFGGRIGEMSDYVSKQYALDYCMSQMARQNHLNNEIYIHDLSHYAVGDHNCLTMPFDKLLAEGFSTRQTDVRPAQSINTAMQLVAVLFQLQSLSQFGGVAASHLDWTMVPYVRKSFAKHFSDGVEYLGGEDPKDDTLSIEDEQYKKSEKAYRYAMEQTVKETHQAVEGMYHNLNTLQSRSGNQLPFTSINYGTCTLPEGRMVIKALLDVSIEGLGDLHRTSIFPCGIFKMKKGVNRKPGDPNYDLYRLALYSTSRRLYPNYANVDWSGNAGYDESDPKQEFSTMGCRTANGYDINGLGWQKDGRGNICPVTIILPTLAMEANRDVETFMDLLDRKIHEAKDMLIERFNYICSQPESSARFMYENGTMEGYDGENIRSALAHGTLALGQLGLAEALELLIGENHTHPKGMDLAKRIEQLFKDRCAEFKNEYKLNFGVYYTPAENLCYTAMQKFKDTYGIIPKVSDKDYFTNSMHVPVWEEINPFEKIAIESELTGYSSAGCITYIEIESRADQNIDALETIVNYAMDHDIPYFAINLPNDMCTECGFTDDIGENCPECGSHNIQRLRRVTGYLTGNYTTAFNKGKQQEVEMRYKHTKKMPTWSREQE